MGLLSVLIPVYNERDTLPALLSRLKFLVLKNGWEVIVVDDCSSDGTFEYLSGYEGRFFRLLRHERNMGKGAAVRTGLAHATSTYTVIQDADLEYAPEEIEELLRTAVERNADAVFGSRFKSGGIKGSLLFYAGNRFLTFLTNLLFASSLTDMETCYKLVRTDLLKSLNLKGLRFEIEPEITAKLLKRGIKIYEVPISYFPRKKGKKIKMKDGFVALKTLLEIRLKKG